MLHEKFTKAPAPPAKKKSETPQNSTVGGSRPQAELYECLDGHLCNATMSSCCNAHGGRARCPADRPVMCRAPRYPQGSGSLLPSHGPVVLTSECGSMRIPSDWRLEGFNWVVYDLKLLISESKGVMTGSTKGGTWADQGTSTFWLCNVNLSI